MQIINWQSIFTEHQYHTWVALQHLDVEISFILGVLQDEVRDEQGWNNVDLSNLKVEVLSITNWWSQGKLIINQNPEAIHFFTGFWADRRFFPLILYALSKGIKIAIMNESYSEVNAGYFTEEEKFLSWIKVKCRPILYKSAIRLMRMVAPGNEPCLFAVSSKAIGQFVKAGIRNNQVFPFGYFIPKQIAVIKKTNHKIPPLRLIFVGALLFRKGLDIAIQAVSEINYEQQGSIILDIFGSGNPENWITQTSPGILYKGMIPFGESQSMITEYDYLILPSRHDGWGVVVNEALLQGIPVIVSDQVGAKCLLDHSGAGVVFKVCDLDELKSIIKLLATDEILRKQHMHNASLISGKILPESAAIYMKAVFEFYFYQQGEKPIVPYEQYQ